MIYKTSSIQQSAAILATELAGTYVGPEPTEDPGRFKFVFDLTCSEEDLNKWKTDYFHRRLKVDPKTYDDCLGIIRDTLKMKKPFRQKRN